MKIFLSCIFIFVLCVLTSHTVLADEPIDDFPVGKVLLIDNDGYFYTNDGEHVISKYSQAGKLILNMSRAGEGPSDIKRLGWFAINPVDSLIYVTEFMNGNRWISKFSKDGKFKGTWKCDIDWTKIQGLLFIQIDSKGNFYIETVKSNERKVKDFMIGTVEKMIIKFSPKGEKLKVIYNLTSDTWVNNSVKGDLTIPFQNTLNWTLVNDKIVLYESHGDSVLVFSEKGKLEKKIAIPFKRERLTDKDISEWENHLKSDREFGKYIKQKLVDLSYWRSRIPFPEYKPALGFQVFSDSHGNIYIDKYSGYSETSKDYLYAKINISSGKSSIVNFGPKDWILGIWKNYFYLNHEIEDGESVLRKVDEKEFFKKK